MRWNKNVYGDLKQFHIKNVVATFNSIEKPSLLTSPDHFISNDHVKQIHILFLPENIQPPTILLESTTLTLSHGYMYHSETKHLVYVSAASYTVSAEQEIGRSSLPFDLHLSNLHRYNIAASWEMGGGD